MSLKKLNLTSVPIPFSGCAGNMNNFVNKSICENFCSGAELKVSEYCNWRKKSSICKLNFYSPHTNIGREPLKWRRKTLVLSVFWARLLVPATKKFPIFTTTQTTKIVSTFSTVDAEGMTTGIIDAVPWNEDICYQAARLLKDSSSKIKVPLSLRGERIELRA